MLVMIIFGFLVGIIYFRINSRDLTALNVENAFYDRFVYCAHVTMLVDYVLRVVLHCIHVPEEDYQSVIETCFK